MREGQKPKETAILFFRMGVTAFGGPAAHISMMEDEVVTKGRWMTREHFIDLVGATNGHFHPFLCLCRDSKSADPQAAALDVGFGVPRCGQRERRGHHGGRHAKHGHEHAHRLEDVAHRVAQCRSRLWTQARKLSLDRFGRRDSWLSAL
jgi:hypothetical protein